MAIQFDTSMDWVLRRWETMWSGSNSMGHDPSSIYESLATDGYDDKKRLALDRDAVTGTSSEENLVLTRCQAININWYLETCIGGATDASARPLAGAGLKKIVAYLARSTLVPIYYRQIVIAGRKLARGWSAAFRRGDG